MAKKAKEDRISVRDLSNAIFVPKQEERVSNDNPDGVTVFTLHGNGDFLDGEGYSVLRDINKRSNFNEKKLEKAETRSSAYAKRVIVNGKTRYYIKTGRHGKFYNPLALIPSDTKQYLRTHGKEEWVYREVNSNVFKLYLNFLKTKNNAWLSTAERENT